MLTKYLKDTINNTNDPLPYKSNNKNNTLSGVVLIREIRQIIAAFERLVERRQGAGGRRAWPVISPAPVSSGIHPAARTSAHGTSTTASTTTSTASGRSSPAVTATSARIRGGGGGGTASRVAAAAAGGVAGPGTAAPAGIRRSSVACGRVDHLGTGQSHGQQRPGNRVAYRGA